MTYIKKDSSPFCNCTTSLTDSIPASSPYLQTSAFDQSDQNWAVFNATSHKIETSIDTFAVCLFSPATNNSGIMTFETPLNNNDLAIRGQVLPASNLGGSQSRGDDQALYVASDHIFQFLQLGGASSALDATKTILTLETIGV